ncbi:FAD-dependent oxidoreductase [Mesorhizobium shangrilense]|uniref:FAD-dependent oxidoreductase n=1 Tax=Mesorhizobium shangrilense TaxID=460060 RepID=A0ABV2DCR3_9HYPH
MAMPADFQVAVIGGGITGASAANHLAAAGFSTVLLERSDFASGTSGRSSRLQHCGLTYLTPGRSIWNFLLHPLMALEHLELARRAMRDRSRFVRASPGQVRPISFNVPLYRKEGIPPWKAKLGFRLLELLDRGGVSLDFQQLGARQAALEPALRGLHDGGDLTGVIRFTEYQFDWPERICLDAVLHARDCGAVVRNYAEVAAIAAAPNGGWHLEVVDKRDGDTHTIFADCVVNATGAWADELTKASGLTLPTVNQGLKGTNVAVRLPPEFRGLAFETTLADGNPFYVIPWRNLHYFGPRDAPCSPSPEGFRADEQTIVDLVEDFRSVFPGVPLSRDDVLYSWAGVRPRTARFGHPDGCEAVLLHDMAKAGAPGYFIHTGGLLMTHRHAGASIAKAVSRRLKPACSGQPVRYVSRTLPTDPSSQPLSTGGTSVSIAQLRFVAEHEQVRHLDDLMFRRTPLGWSERMGLDVAHAVAEAISDIMGWSAREVAVEVDRYKALVAHQFGMELACD